MAELKVREYAEKLIREAGLSTGQLDGDDIKLMLNAKTVEEVQRWAIVAGISGDIVEQTSDEVGVEYSVSNLLQGALRFASGDRGIIGGPESVEVADEAGELGDTTRRSYTVDPRGSDTAIPNNGMTPAEQEAMLALTGGDPDHELAGLFANAEGLDADEISDLLPDIPGVNRAMIEAKVATPGYQFYYGDPELGAYGNPLVNPTIYKAGDELEKWTLLTPESRARYTRAMIDAGIIEQESVGAYTSGRSTQAEVDAWNELSNQEKIARQNERPDTAQGRWGGRGENFEGTAGGVDPSGVSEIQVEGYKKALSAAGYLGTSPMSAIFAFGESADFVKKSTSGGSGRGGGGRAPFVVPASLRTIPDYPTLQQNVTDMMRQVMGRKPEDWEVTMLADEMQGHYKDKNLASIDAARAAYDQGNRGVGMEFEVPDPGQRTQKYLEETWGDEIDRIKDIGERSNTNNLLMQSLTQGSRMVGG